MAAASVPATNNRINEISDVECHTKWLPPDTVTISRQRVTLQIKMNSEPWLQDLHYVSLAHLSFTEDNEEECENLLKKAESVTTRRKQGKKSQKPLKGIRFLIAAMRLHLRQKLHQFEEAELQSQLSDLDIMWQNASLRAAVWTFKGWTLQNFEGRGTPNALAAFREALRLDSAPASIRFLSLYGTASAMVRRGRKADLGAEIGQDKLELWEDAHQILKEQDQMHPVFLAEYAEAIALTAVHSRRCEDLAKQAFDQAKKLSGLFQVYVILSKVYRALKEWQSPDEMQRLSIKQKEILDAGKTFYHTETDETLKSDFAFQFALYYIKQTPRHDLAADKQRYKTALYWLDKVDPRNVWARMRRLSVKESLLVLENSDDANEYQLIQTEYENLLKDESIFDDVRDQIRFEFGRFLLVILVNKDINLIEDQAAVSCKYMRDAIINLKSNRFISLFKMKQITACLAAAASESDEAWFSQRLQLMDYFRTSRFPTSLYEAHIKWRLGCKACSSEQQDGTYKVTQSAGTHDCVEDLLLVTHLVPHLFNHVRNQCWHVIREPTDADAANGYESQLWQLETAGQFSRRKFLNRVRQHKF